MPELERPSYVPENCSIEFNYECVARFWEASAQSALSGLLASGNYDGTAPERAGELADALVSEWRIRFEKSRENTPGKIYAG